MPPVVGQISLPEYDPYDQDSSALLIATKELFGELHGSRKSIPETFKNRVTAIAYSKVFSNQDGGNDSYRDKIRVSLYNDYEKTKADPKSKTKGIEYVYALALLERTHEIEVLQMALCNTASTVPPHAPARNDLPN